MKNKEKTIYLVLPCHNEQEVLPKTAAELLSCLDRLAACKKISRKSRIVFVDDGSTDRTWDVICRLGRQDSRVAGISLWKNLGQQKALFTGLMAVRPFCDGTVTMDADLQDDPAILPAILDAWTDGFEIVDAVRIDRSCDSLPKQAGARLFYCLMKLLNGGTCMEGDYRLLGSRALKKLSFYYGSPGVLRVLIPRLKLPVAAVPFIRNRRPAGQSKYNLKNMMLLSISGILSTPFFSRLYLEHRHRVNPWRQIQKTINLPP